MLQFNYKECGHGIFGFLDMLEIENCNFMNNPVGVQVRGDDISIGSSNFSESDYFGLLFESNIT